MKLKRRSHSVPELQMAAMPDLIFTVLFFFMIATHMKEETVQLSYHQPEGTNLVKVTNKAAVINVYVGRDNTTGNYCVQVGNQIVPLEELSEQLADKRQTIASDQLEFLTASLQADADVPMNIINKVKLALRDAHILKINYSALENETISDSAR